MHLPSQIKQRLQIPQYLNKPIHCIGALNLHIAFLKDHIILEFLAAHIVPLLAKSELCFAVVVFELFALCFNKNDVTAFCLYDKIGIV